MDRLPINVGKDLRSGSHLDRRKRLAVVHLLVDVARSCSTTIARRQMSVLAQRGVTLYPGSLQDRINDSVIGTGYDSLLRQMVFRNENCIRVSKGKTKDSMRDSPEPGNLLKTPNQRQRNKKGMHTVASTSSQKLTMTRTRRSKNKSVI